MKTRILLILPSFHFGGTVFSTLNMIMALDKQKYDFTIFAMSHVGPVKKQFEGFNVLPENIIIASLCTKFGQVEGFWRKMISLLLRGLDLVISKFGLCIENWALKRVARQISSKNKYDIVASCQEDGSTVMASYFSQSKRIAWIRCEYSTVHALLSERQREFRKRLFPQFDKIVCVSHTTKDGFLTIYPDLKDKVVAIHNIQKTSHIIQESKEQMNDLFSTDYFNIVSVGRIARVKRYSHIPEIAAKMFKTGAKFKWYIIGDGNEGGEADALKENLTKYHMQEHVICMGSRVNPYPYIAAADLIVVPSKAEACPRTVIESQILHTPVVCANFKSAAEFVTNDVNGFLVPLEELWDVISKMVNDKSLYNRIKNQCNQYSFQTKEILFQLEELFSTSNF